MSEESTLARAHPDHPTLDLSTEEEASPTPVHSPPQVVTTPSSLSPSGSPVMSSIATKRSALLSDGNARSQSVTVADGQNTFGVLNRHPAVKPATSEAPSGEDAAHGQSSFGSFRVGVSEDRNKRCRRTMEDAHSFIYDYAGVRGQGYFAVFDGHAGKFAAEWCGQNFHEYLLDGLVESPSEPIPDLLNRIFHVVDARIAQIGYKRKQFSGCTAVTAFLRVEENVDKPPFGFANPAITTRGLLEEKDLDEDEEERRSRRSSMGAGSSGSMGGAATPEPSVRRKLSSRRIRDFVRGLTGRMQEDESAIEDDHSSEERVEAIEPKSSHGLRRVLYTANVGDARAVLSRSGKAVRLTYDHKGSDAQEAKRIMDAGGFMMNNRVNGVLAVTRSLGDASMKEFVVGSPYTTETELDDDDEFLIIACDGLWDVCEDQDAVDLVRNLQDPQEASKRLLEHALNNYSADNISIMVIRLSPK